jgi:glucose-1-phosphate cytidylyltransferase
MIFAILAGGKGERLSDLTQVTPKPLIELLGTPILFHVAYRFWPVLNQSSVNILYGDQPKRFQAKFHDALSQKNQIPLLEDFIKKSEFNLIKTEEDADTFSRIKPLFRHNDDIMVTYGDTLTDINVSDILSFWSRNRQNYDALTCITRPSKRFSQVTFDEKTHQVINFSEKDGKELYHVGCGFIILKSSIYETYKESTSLEQQVLSDLAKKDKLIAYEHKGFWHPIDYLGDLIKAESLVKNKNYIEWLQHEI